MDRPFTAVSFYQFLQEGKLMASRCARCGSLHLPPRGLCSRCHSPEMEWMPLKGTGRLAAFTAISIVPTQMATEGYGRENPYCTGIVELEEGPRITARLLGVDAKAPEKILIGAPVRLELPDSPKEGARALLAFRVTELS